MYVPGGNRIGCQKPKLLIIALYLSWIFGGVLATESTPKESTLRSATSTESSEVEPVNIRDMSNPDYLLDLANVNIKYGAIDRAEALLSRAYDHAANDVRRIVIIRTQLELVELALRHNQIDMAEAILKQVLQNAKDNPGIASKIGDIQHRIGVERNETAAVAETTPVVKTAQPDVPSWQAPAATSNAAGSAQSATVAAAKREAEPLGGANPNDKIEQYKLAISYQQAKQFDKAIDVYKKLMTTEGESKEEVRGHAIHIGLLLLQAAKKDEAVVWMKENFRNTTLSRDYSALAMFYEQAGMHTDSEEALTKEAELAKSPDEKAFARLRIAELAFRKKDWAKAEEVAKAVAAEFKDNGNVQARASAMVKRVEFEKNRPAMPTVATKPAATPANAEPGAVKPVAPVVPSPEVPSSVTPAPPSPVKTGADAKPTSPATNDVKPTPVENK